MALSDLIAQIDAEIAKLEQAKALLGGAPAPKTVRGRGRPKGSKNASVKVAAPNAAKLDRLSPEGRKSIAEAMKRRWAERRKQSSR